MEELNLIRRWWLEWRNRWNSIAGSAILRLGDASGESRLSVRNSDDQEVFYVRSDGRTSVEPGEGADGEALLRDGRRSLLGDLAVAQGKTIDGVDISSFADSVNSWQSTHVQAGSDPHPQYITASTAASTYARGDTSVNGTNGLSGGGALGTGTNTLNLSVNAGYAFAWTAQHSFGEGAKIAQGKSLGFADNAGVVDAEVKRAAANTLTLGDGDRLQSTDFSAGSYGYRIDASGDAEFNNIRARGEFAASTFRVNEVSASAGTLGVFDSAAVVWEDFTTPVSLNGVGTMKVRNSPSGGALFADGDRLQIKTWDGASVVDAWFIVTAVDNKGAYSECDVTLKSAATSKVIRAGTAVVGWGASGAGAVTLSADGTFGSSANLSVMSHAGSPWDTKTLHLRMGNLNGAYGYSANVYGFAAGDSATNYVSVDGTNGFRVIRSGTTRFQVDTAGALTLRNASGDSVISLDSNGSRIDNVLTLGLNGEIRQGKGEIGNALNPFQGLRIWGSTDSGSFFGRIGGYYGNTLQWYSGVDGKLYAGGGNVVLSQSGVAVASTMSSRGVTWTADKSYGFYHEDTTVTQLGTFSQTNTVNTNPRLWFLNVGSHSNPELNFYTEWTGVSGSPSGVGVLITAKNGASVSSVSVRPSGTTIDSGLNVGSATGAASGQVIASAGISGTTGTFSSGLNVGSATGAASGKIVATGENGSATEYVGALLNYSQLVSGSVTLVGYRAIARAGHTSGTLQGLQANSTQSVFDGNGGTTSYGEVLTANAEVGTGHAVGDLNMIRVFAPTKSGTGSISALKGILVGNMSGGSSSNYSIYTEGGRHYFTGETTQVGAFTVESGVNVGSATGAGTGEIKASGSVSGTNGTFTGGLNVGTATGATSGSAKVQLRMALNGATLGSQATINVCGQINAYPATSGNPGEAALRVRGGNSTGTVESGTVLDISASGSAGQQGGWMQVRNAGDYSLNYQMLINPNGGNVGIGTTTASYKLDVAGTLRATGDVTLSGADIITDATTGTRLGTATTQKIGFYGVTAVAQRASANQAAVAATGATQTTPWGFTTAAQANAIVTLVNEMRTTLVNLGLMKGSA